jgi:hypothetical protein
LTSLDKNKPCLVETSQGFSVKYNERFLYSKYNPEKNILQIVENISILPGTLILCFSPLLGYGINKLIQKGVCSLQTPFYINATSPSQRQTH